jgi:hypothetical protein
MDIIDYSQLFRDGLEIPSTGGNATLKCHDVGELVAPSGKIVAVILLFFPRRLLFQFIYRLVVIR